MINNRTIEIAKSLAGLKLYNIEGSDDYICYFPDFSGVDSERIIHNNLSVLPDGIKHQLDKNGHPEIGVMFKACDADYAAGLIKVTMLQLQLAK